MAVLDAQFDCGMVSGGNAVLVGEIGLHDGVASVCEHFVHDDNIDSVWLLDQATLAETFLDLLWWARMSSRPLTTSA